MLPNWIQQKSWIIQHSDGNRKPKQYAPPQLIDAYEVARLMNWDTLDKIEEARAVGFPHAVRFENRIVNGGVESRIGLYRPDQIATWREQVATLIHAKLL